MLREYAQFFRNYQNLTKPRRSYFLIILCSVILARISALLLPLLAAFIIDDLTVKDVDSTFVHLGMFAAVLIFYYVMVTVYYHVYGDNLNDCYDRLQFRLLDKLMTIDSDFLREIEKGSVINTVHDYLIDIVSANDQIANFMARLVQVVITCVIIGIFSLPIMLLMILFVLIFFFVSQYVDRRFNFYRRKNLAHDNNYSTMITQALGGLNELKSFNILTKFQNKVSLLQQKFDADYSRQSYYAMFRDNDVLAFQYILQFVAYVILILMVSQGQAEVGILVMVVTYQTQLFNCARELARAAINMREVQTSVDSVRKILNYKPAQALEFGNLMKDDISGLVEFHDVSFHNRRTKLSDINFTLHPRQFTAIVGPPLSGKSELFDLLLRLERPDSGTITIDGINIKKFAPEVYATNVTVADQSPFLFDVSIRRNLSFIDPDVEHQIAACKAVGIHDFIESLPNGYHTVLHKNARNISGGQQQMISIARTILSPAEILLFDGTASSLDTTAAAQLLKVIKKLKIDHTVVMITRRPDLMAAADRIIVLKEGRVIDSGTHAGLLKRCKTYRDLQTPIATEANAQVERDKHRHDQPSVTELSEGEHDV